MKKESTIRRRETIRRLIKQSEVIRFLFKIIFNIILTYKELHTEFNTLIGKRYTQYKLRSGEKFITRIGTNDKDIINEVYKNNYRLKIPKDGVVIDVGANIGAYSIFASKNAEIVHAFEPYPGSYDMMVKNIAVNQVKNIKTYQKGIAGKEGIRRLYFSPMTMAGNSIYSLVGQRSCEIDCITLKDFMESNKIKKVDILKLDAEGAEYEILYNLPKEMLSKIRNVTMECHSMELKLNNEKCNADGMKRFLEDNGFKTLSLVNNRNDHHYIYATKK